MKQDKPFPPKKQKKLKKLFKEAVAIAKGQEIGKIQAHKNKPLEESFKEHLGKLIDRINVPELVAVIGITPIVKAIIVDPGNGFLTTVNERVSAWQYHLSSVQAFFDVFEWGLPQQKEVKSFLKTLFGSDELGVWLVSFSISYIIIHNAGNLLGLLEKGMVPVVGMLLGAI